MLFLYNFIIGWLEITINSNNSEKLLNNSAKERLILRKLHYEDHKIRAYISVSDFRKLRFSARKTGARIHIVSRGGLPFIIDRNKKRLGMLTGFFAGIALLYFLSLFVWSVQVTGNDKISDAAILEACERIGIHQGCFKSNISTISDAQKLLLEADGLAWASLNIEGSVLTVNVSEIKNKLPDQKEANDLIASADGKITKIDLTSGNAVVAVGDYVKKGDLLVSGILEGLEKTQFVPSSGSVYADTQHRLSVSRTFIQRETLPTGKRLRKSVLSVFNIDIPLYAGKTMFKFRSETKKHELTLFGKKLPVAITEKTFFEVKDTNVSYTPEQLEQQLLSDADELVKSMDIKTYEITEKNFIKENDRISLQFVISAKEDIAQFQKILIDGSN